MNRHRRPSLTLAPQSGAPSRASRGFSLIEVMVASAVFLLIMIAVYQVYMRSLEGHKLGVNQADLIQSTRFGFQEMATRIRSAGFEFDLDGPPSDGTDNQSDESIEYMGATAIAVRANYDFASEQFRGREELYELTGSSCCPIVTTGNDEILAFALGKDEGDPNPPTETMTLYMDLDAPRDGRVSTNTGLIEGEETIEIPNVALTDFTDPPYVLYQFTWSDPVDGPAVLERRPLVDNILGLEFQYFDEGGNDLAADSGGSPVALPDGDPNPSGDANPASDGRSRRERVRKVKIFIKAMTPEPDLRYVDDDDPDPVTRKHRKWELVEEVHTFNVGRRGQKDKDVDPPDPVTDVQLCSGQCGMVRVDWRPGPPEDRITDHIVILAECTGGSGANYSNPIASFVVVSDLDLTVDPEREYAVFDIEDDPDLVDGLEVCARVIPRDSSGSEADEPSDSDNNPALDPATSNDYTTIVDYSRSEAPGGGESSGYDPADTDWPNAAADNAGGMEITDDDSLVSYPSANAINLEFQTPSFVLDRQTLGGLDYDWTTATDATGYAGLQEDVDAGETCHRVDLSPDATPSLRTPVEDAPRSANEDEPNLYVFRVSGSDQSTWGPNQDDCPGGANCIGEARNFMPYAGNLYAYESVSLAGSSFNFFDFSESAFYTPEDATSQYEARYLSTATRSVEADGEDSPVQSITPGEVYYYRVRVTDNCWADGDPDLDIPANGIEDSTEGTAQELTAWSTTDDFATDADWREAAVKISPFYPPLLPKADAQDERDVPADASDSHDSDAVDMTSLSSIDTWALPAYARPQLAQGNAHVRPEKPSEFYLSRANDSASSLLPREAVTLHPGVRVVFNSAKRTAPEDTTGAAGLEPTSVGYTFYRLMRKPVTYTPGTALSPADVNFEANDPGLDLVAEFRLSDAGLREYTIDRRAEVLDGKNSVLDNDGLYLDPAGGHHYYKLFTAQVTEGAYHDGDSATDPLPVHVADDGITDDDARYSIGSRGFLFPSDFYDEVAHVGITTVPSSGIAATAVNVSVTMDLSFAPGSPEENCVDVRGARLLAYDKDLDQFIGSSDWMSVPHAGVPADCDFSFSSSLIEQALRTYPGAARFRVELSEVDEAATDAAWDKQPRGARVLSGLVGEAGDYQLSTTCAADCSAGNILGDIDDAVITTDLNDTVLVIDIPVAACNTEAFSLLQLDLVLDRGGQGMPNFEAATLSGLRSGFELPAPEFAADDGGNYRLRWFEGSFCDMSGFCDFPVVDETSTSIELRLRFDGPVCDPIRLDNLNFRVPVDVGSGIEELLCSNRGEFPPDAPGDVDEPDYYCSVAGVSTDDCGRGPALLAEPCDQNVDCVPDCVAGVCPVNIDFAIDPITDLESDLTFGDDSIVTITQTEDCSGGCALNLTEIIVRLECDSPDRDCSETNLPSFVSAELVHEVDPAETLPAPTISGMADDHWELTWDPLINFDVQEGETFTIKLQFNGSMVDTKATTWHLQFGSPLPAVVDCDETDELDIPTP